MSETRHNTPTLEMSRDKHSRRNVKGNKTNGNSFF